VAGGCLVEGHVEVHRDVLKGHRGGEQGKGRAPCQGPHPLSRTAVALLNVGDDVGRHSLPVVIPPRRRVHAGLTGMPREGRGVIQVEDPLLQGGRDHHLLCAVGIRASAEDPIGVLEERDAPAGVQGLDNLLAVPILGLGREHRVAVDVTERGVADVFGGVEPPDRICPHGEGGDSVVERRLVPTP